MSYISRIFTTLIVHSGYSGIFVLMLLESACIPIPSEAVMPFAGSLAATKHAFNLPLLALVGAFGNLAGSVLAYRVGAWKGRGFFEAYGKYVLINHEDLDLAESWFQKRGQATVLFTRVLPIVRTFISLPAGISKMPFGKFCIFTFAGALPWCYFLTVVGYKLGQHWASIGRYFHKADIVIGAALIILFAVWIRRHNAQKRK